VLKLGSDGKYRIVRASLAFPFLPMDQFTKFVLRMPEEEQTSVAREFQTWVRTLVKP
jgi:hypothetical protein